MHIDSERVEVGTARLELLSCGRGPAVLLLPSLGRGATDFEALMRHLAGAGFRALALNPRGIGGSEGPTEGITLHDLARDAAETIAACTDGAAHVIGHAFGHRVACCLAVDHPQRVRRLVLLGAGGLVEADREASAAFKHFFTPSLTEAERYEAIKTANFAARSDASSWLEGWWPDAVRSQIQAAIATPHEEWWSSGSADILIVQGLEDRMAPPENGRTLVRMLGARVRLVEVEHAGHALLPEQPERVTAEIVRFLGEAEESRSAD